MRISCSAAIGYGIVDVEDTEKWKDEEIEGCYMYSYGNGKKVLVINDSCTFLDSYFASIKEVSFESLVFHPKWENKLKAAAEKLEITWKSPQWLLFVNIDS